MVVAALGGAWDRAAQSYYAFVIEVLASWARALELGAVADLALVVCPHSVMVGHRALMRRREEVEFVAFQLPFSMGKAMGRTQEALQIFVEAGRAVIVVIAVTGLVWNFVEFGLLYVGPRDDVFAVF